MTTQDAGFFFMPKYDSQISSAWRLQGNLYEPEEAVSAVPLHFSAG